MNRRPHRGGRTLWIALAALVLAATVTLIFWRPGAVEERHEEVETVAAAGDAATVTDDGIVADLYFPGRGGRLHTERREVASDPLPERDQAEAQIAALVEALIAGPHTAGLQPPLPPSVTVESVYLIDGEVVLDLASPEDRPPPSGSERELLTVYSLVNTVLLNTAGADRLVLLWNGQQPTTFAGHLDTARPLRANRDMVARDPVARDPA